MVRYYCTVLYCTDGQYCNVLYSTDAQYYDIDSKVVLYCTALYIIFIHQLSREYRNCMEHMLVTILAHWHIFTAGKLMEHIL